MQMDGMDTVWSVILFMEILCLEIVWGFLGENMVNQIAKQSP